ncbi:Folylpolyglutamate synthase, partial [Globisporangium splendens]
MALRRTPALRLPAKLLRPYTALSHAPFRQAPSPAAFASSIPMELTSAPQQQQQALEDASTTATYEFLLQRLYQVNRFTAVKLGIENMKQLNAAFGDPASRYEVVHVAGTNGKGSVSFKIAKALERSGYKTGLFVSPHVACFRERIQINGTLISEEQVCETLSEIFNISAQLRIPATFFEITTMLAFQHFAKENVDCVVLETGLGGRLDATNIVTPSLSVITSIGMDHMRILGNTVTDIAREKAGIMKSHVPVVIGPHAPLEIMRDHASRLHAPLVQVPHDSAFVDDFNAENTAIAREAIVQLNELSHRAGKSELSVDLESRRVVSALESRPPCRFQVFHIVRPNSSERKVTIVLDVAHNPPAIEKLVQLLSKRFPDKKFRFVCGFSADKDMRHVISTIASACRQNASEAELRDDAALQARMHLVKANNPRGASLEEVNYALAGPDEDVHSVWTRPFTSISTIDEGVAAAVDAARTSSDDEVVVVCGSVFLMAEARQALGFKEPIDSPSLSAVAGAHLSTPASRLAAAKTAAASS